MRELDGRRMHSRVTGKQALERSLRSLLIRLHRYGQHRATSRTDLLWCAKAIDSLTALLTPNPEPRAPTPETRMNTGESSQCPMNSRT